MRKKLLTGLLICAFAIAGTTTVTQAFNDTNETMDAAIEIKMGDSYVGETEPALDSSGKKESYDHDWYKFTINKKQWVKLSITPHYDGLSYNIYKSDGYTILDDGSAIYAEDTAVITEKLPAGTYYMDICATWPNREGKYTVDLSNTGIKYDKTPFMLQMKTNSKRTILKATWDKVENADGYVIYQYNSKTKKYKKAGTTKKTKYTIKNLKTETQYKIKVSAYIQLSNGKKVEGKPTDPQFIWTNPKKPGTTKITGITKGANDTDEEGHPIRYITVKWTKAKDATGYDVYYRDISTGSYKCVLTTSTNSTVLRAGIGFSYKLYVVPKRTKNGLTTKGSRSPIYTTPKILRQ